MTTDKIWVRILIINDRGTENFLNYDFGGQRSKVKVAMDIYWNKLVNIVSPAKHSGT